MRTLTDADVFYGEGAGIPTALVSIPLRRMHTPVETADLADLEATRTLAGRLSPAACRPAST